MKIGVFVGSFDPFTVGHDSIVTRSLGLFDRLVIGVVGDQVHKPGMAPAEERMQAIAELFTELLQRFNYEVLITKFIIRSFHPAACRRSI